MAEANNSKLYTTHEVARLLGVTPITVIRWIDGGKFRCFTTVGGHRRIAHDELVRFAQTYNLPWQGDEDLRRRKEFVVLAVDDEVDALELLHDMFIAMKGVRLIAVSNGFAAGAKLVEDHPDLILLDFMMPELDGFEFCRFVRQDPRFKQVPVVAMSGLRGEDDMRKIREAGVDDFLPKPFSEEDLVKKVEKHRLIMLNRFPERAA